MSQIPPAFIKMQKSSQSVFVVLAVCLFSAIGGMTFNTMPILLSAVSQAFSLSTGQLGTLSLTAGLGYLAGTLTGPMWVDRVNWRFASLAIVIGAVAAFFVTSRLSAASVYYGFATFGFFCALAVSLGMRILADMSNPERTYGTRLSVELISIGVFISVLPIVFVARAGFAGAMIGIAIFTALLGLGALLVPTRSRSVKSAKSVLLPTWRQAGPSWSVLAIFSVYLIANVGLFFFLAVIAGKYEPSPEQLGVMFGGLKWLGGIAGAVGALIGARAGLRVSHLGAFGIVLLGLAGLFLSKTFTGFMISSWVWEFGFTLGCLYQTSAIARFDPTKKLIVWVPMAFAVSMILGGKLAGELLEAGTPNGLYILVGLCAFLPSLYVLFARPDPEKYKPSVSQDVFQ